MWKNTAPESCTEYTTQKLPVVNPVSLRNLKTLSPIPIPETQTQTQTRQTRHPYNPKLQPNLEPSRYSNSQASEKTDPTITLLAPAQKHHDPYSPSKSQWQKNGLRSRSPYHHRSTSIISVGAPPYSEVKAGLHEGPALQAFAVAAWGTTLEIWGGISRPEVDAVRSSSHVWELRF